MIVRSDLKNTIRYKELVNKHKEDVLKNANLSLYISIGITIIYGIFSYSDRDFLFDLATFHINCLMYIGIVLFIYNWNFQVYEITVSKKWFVDCDEGKDFLYRISDGIQVDNSNYYQVFTNELYNKIKVGETYLFLARKNVLYDIL